MLELNIALMRHLLTNKCTIFLKRLVEQSLFGGSLLGVTATCALELGVDVGMLDATLHMGFPRSFSSLWQQMGRSGRSGRPSISVFICFDSPVDQFFARSPSALFHSSPEAVAVNPDNDHILRAHLLCACSELPLSNSDGRYFGAKFAAMVRSLRDANDVIPTNPLLRPSSSSSSSCSSSRNGSSSNSSSSSSTSAEFLSDILRIHPLHPFGSNPAKEVNIRMIDPVTITIVNDDRGGLVIDSVEYSRAFFTLFEGAIHLHGGGQYLVHKLDLNSKIAHTRPTNVRWFTSSRNRSDISILKLLQVRGMLKFGSVQVVRSVSGYVKRWIDTGEVFEEGTCCLPNLEFETKGVWIDIPLSVKKALQAEGFNATDAVHAVNHILITVAPLLLFSDESDIATEHDLISGSRILLYDRLAGGVGACDELFSTPDMFPTLMQKAKELLSTCPCQDDDENGKRGCPSCLLCSSCNAYNNHLSKAGALKLLDLLVALEKEAAMADSPAAAATRSPTTKQLLQSPDDSQGSQHFGDDTENDKGTTIGQEISPTRDTPRKRRRKCSLKAARFTNHPGTRSKTTRLLFT